MAGDGTHAAPMIRLGIIGCGGMGKAHAGTVESLSDRVRLTGFADPDRARAEALAALGQIATADAVATLRQVLAEGPDALRLSAAEAGRQK